MAIRPNFESALNRISGSSENVRMIESRDKHKFIIYSFEYTNTIHSFNCMTFMYNTYYLIKYIQFHSFNVALLWYSNILVEHTVLTTLGINT